MNYKLKQISSLEKICPKDSIDFAEIESKVLLKGESFSYQIALESKLCTDFKVSVKSPLASDIKLYAVKNVAMDFACPPDSDDDFITKEPGLMPDVLMPLELENNIIRANGDSTAIWITVNIPENTAPGMYPVEIIFDSTELHFIFNNENIHTEKTMMLEVLDATVPKQKTIFTQWFYADCIATAHNVEIYSEEHWGLIDKYMALASELGINMILTPVVTPPLDTQIGTTRPCVQLVKIEKNGDKYIFDFTLLEKWILLAQKNNMEYFEISHLFSQWGLTAAPNIKVSENGKESYKFGWHTDAKSDEYRDFLTQFLPELISFLKKQGIKDKCWFHISDEPHAEHLEQYKYAHDIVVPLIDGCRTMDAISSYNFYETGLIPNPVTATNHIDEFLANKTKNQWAYYCCSQRNKVGNRFIAMPSYRNRILGLQLYKYNIVGFLQWGYNFYFNQHSRKEINPYITTSSEKAFPAGDPFSVYPTNKGVVPSLRAIIFKEALCDIEICRKLEEYIGREKVVQMIDAEAGMELTFSEYPRNNDYIPGLIDKMKQIIKEYISTGTN